MIIREEPITVTPRERVESYDWDERLEKSQADRYMPYLNELMGSGDRSGALGPFGKHYCVKFLQPNVGDVELYPLRCRSTVLIDAANHHTTLLSHDGLQDQLGYKFTGTTDVAAVTRLSRSSGLPHARSLPPAHAHTPHLSSW